MALFLVRWGFWNRVSGEVRWGEVRPKNEFMSHHVWPSFLAVQGVFALWQQQPTVFFVRNEGRRLFSQRDSSAERHWCAEQVSGEHDAGCGARTHSSRSARGSPNTISTTLPAEIAELQNSRYSWKLVRRTCSPPHLPLTRFQSPHLPENTCHWKSELYIKLIIMIIVY